MKLTNYLNHTIDQLEAMTTPQLMMLRKICFGAFRTCGSPCHCLPTDKTDIEHNAKLAVLQSKVNTILPHREHVLSKPEAKAIRQAAAKKGR